MGLSVIGAGLGRTGTLSLKLALERLGFGPCYHMKEVFQQLDAHVPLWDRAANDEEVDWDTIFEGYQSAVDFPAATFYRELADHYSTSKVILTVRASDRWYQSFSETILIPLVEPLPDHLAAWGAMTRRVIADRIFGGDILDRAQVIASYEQHNEAVRKTIPSERLLVYEVAEGWSPLCRFLGASIPDEPFPKVNSTDEWRSRIARFRRDDGEVG